MRAIYPGMMARTSDGGVMRVTDVLIDRQDRTPRYIVLNPWGYFGPDVLAPFAAVWRVDQAVHVSLTSGEIAALPRYGYTNATGLCSRSAWRHGADRKMAPRPAAHPVG